MGPLNNTPSVSKLPLLLRAWPLRGAALVLAVLLSLLACWLGGSQLHQLDEQVGSLSWSLAPAAAPERRIVIIDIDDKSLQQLGPWPWPRETVAKLMRKLDAAGVNLKLVDVLFDAERPGDLALREALSSGSPTVLAQLFALDSRSAIHADKPQGALPWSQCPGASLPARDVIAPLASLLGARTSVGHITPLVDPDGSVRRVPALICEGQGVYTSLPLAGAIALTGEAPQLQAGHGLFDPAWWLQLGPWRVPLDTNGVMRVSYRQPRSAWIAVSAADLLQDRLPPGMLQGQLALVGSTAFGIRDAVPTPQGAAVGGVEVHAQELSALLDARTPYSPKGAPLWSWLLGVGFSAVLMVLARARRAAWLLPAGAVALGALSWGLHTWALLTLHWWLEWLPGALFALLAGLLLSAAELTRARFERQRLYQNLSSYLPHAAARRIALQPPSEQVSASRQDATVLFADLRNFNAFSEGGTPERTATVLQLFYSVATSIVERHGGVVEQMVGDGLMAVWNGSQDCPDHPRQAIAAAQALWKELTPQLPLGGSRSSPPLALELGLERGSVLVGSFGPASRRVHTVLGEAVSVAAALQGMSEELAQPILVGPHLADSGSGSTLLRLGEFLLPGFTSARVLYALPVAIDPRSLQQAVDAEGLA